MKTHGFYSVVISLLALVGLHENALFVNEKQSVSQTRLTL